jgi:hypothetical protein
MVIESNIDVGSCVSASQAGQFSRIDCSGADNKNYCCIYNPNGLHLNAASRNCCTYEEYSDQHWATISLIRCGQILLASVFAITMGTLFALLWTSWGVSEKDIQASRRIVLRELMKRQILYQSKQAIDPSALTSFRKLSDTLSRSRSKKKKMMESRKQDGKRKSDEKVSKAPSVLVRIPSIKNVSDIPKSQKQIEMNQLQSQINTSKMPKRKQIEMKHLRPSNKSSTILKSSRSAKKSSKMSKSSAIASRSSGKLSNMSSKNMNSRGSADVLSKVVNSGESAAQT